MFNNVKILFPVSLFIFVFIEIFLVKAGQFQVGIFIYFIYSLVLYLIDEKYIITFFVYNLPLAPIILTDYKILSFVGPHEIIYGFSFFVLLSLIRKRKIKLIKSQKFVIAFTYFLFFVLIYPMFKDIMLGIYPDKGLGLFYIFKNFVRFYLYYVSLVMLIKLIYLEDIFKYIMTGINYSIITIVISMIYTRELILMGAGILVEKERSNQIIQGIYKRYTGFYAAGGDENSVGIFMAIAFGFYLALYEKNGNVKKYAIFMGFTVLGVLLTGSRTSFMALATVILIFMITNKSGKDKISILLAIVVFYFIFSKQLDLVLQRFLDPSAKAAIDPNSEQKGRVWKWIFYTNWLMKNPQTFVIGNLQNINFHVAPHNYFIWTLYHVGIFPLLFLLNLLKKLLVDNMNFKLTKFSLKSAYYIIPFPFIVMTVNSIGSFIYLTLFIPLGAYFLSDKILKSQKLRKTINNKYVRNNR